MDQTRPSDDQGRGTGPPLYGDATAHARDRTIPVEGEGIGSLVSDLLADLQGIVRGEVRLAKAELREDASQIARAAGMLVAGGVLGLVGLIFLMLAATFLLNEWIEELWISAGVVALALLAIAAILALVGRSRLSASNLKPEETIESLKEDQQWAKQQVRSVGR